MYMHGGNDDTYARWCGHTYICRGVYVVYMRIGEEGGGAYMYAFARCFDAFEGRTADEHASVWGNSGKCE